jgi:hypothetical protein
MSNPGLSSVESLVYKKIGGGRNSVRLRYPVVEYPLTARQSMSEAQLIESLPNKNQAEVKAALGSLMGKVGPISNLYGLAILTWIVRNC